MAPPGPGAAALDAIRPARASSKGGVQITLTGQNLPTSGTVTVAGQPATAVEFRSPAEIVATVPPSGGALGPVAVTVSGGGKTVTRSDLFSYYPGTLSFATPRTFNVDTKPSGIAVADLNGDGKLDAVTANLNAATLSVLVGNGDGTFQPARGTGAGSRPLMVRTGDLNGDGKLDLVVARDSAQGPAALLGKGDGTFQSPVAIGAPYNCYALALADVNADGKLDVVAALTNGYVFELAVSIGKGDGTFKSPIEGTTFSSSVYGLAVADWNGDTKPDVAIAEYDSGYVGIWPGQGDGKLGAAKRTAVGSSPMGIASADVNGDGKPDLLTSNSGSNSVSLLLGKGDGTVQAQPVIQSGGSSPRPLVLADVDLDGTPDLVLVNQGSGTVSVLLGRPDSKFQAAQNFTAAGQHVDLAVADLNGDKLPDLIMPSSSTASVSVLINVSK